MASWLNSSGVALRDSTSPAKWFTTSYGGQTLNGTSGADSLSGKANTVSSLAGGAGDDSYALPDLKTKPIEAAGGGVDTVTTWWRDYVLADNIENLNINGIARVEGNGLANIIRGDSSAQTIDGGLGNDVLIGGGGRDTFLVTKGDGSDVIVDFQTSGAGDLARLDGYSLTSFAQVKSAMSQVGSDVKLALSGSESLIFRNHKIADFTADDFQLPVSTAGRTLTFADEFNSLSLWNGKSGTWETTQAGSSLNVNGSTLAGNKELEWYINSNYTPTASVKPWTINNGVLEITAAKAPAAIKPYINNYNYTSGMIQSHQSFSQTYGYFEMRAQLPAGQGLWPAFWLMPQDGTWPPELDIMEVVGSKPTSLVTTLRSMQTGSLVETSIGSTVADMTKGFHTYGVDWQKDTIRWYFDGLEVASIATPADLHKPMYMVANLAVGGTWPGNPDATTTFPSKMQIDYIHVYSGDGTAAAPTTPVTPTPAPSSPDKSPTGGTLFALNAEDKPLYESAVATKGFVASGSYQTLTGTSGADALRGNGTSTLTGGAGDDTYYVSKDKVVESSGGGTDTVIAYANHTLAANVENLFAFGANTTATGNSLDNVIQGGAGRQTLDGGAGNDVLKGGAGSDIFVFGSGHDRVLDFQGGSGSDKDLLRISKADFSSVAAVQSASHLVDADHDGAIDDVVITHGSDTMELLNLSLSTLDAGHILIV
ncbi:family 16 glycosylhydrolase [Methylobacterium sp. Leaf113]|uniref:family 16 glycosylhydrolase n=1 Tax=Methylobacterium sp. Leaf113 TaxID=1736259 RepID=UPI0009EA1EA2|nr:family 16 glycosylhydrolase [Methylobacterium sp. Leaf113]